LNIHAEKERLYFKLANSSEQTEVGEETSVSASNQGLKNVRKRLELYYPGDFVLLEKQESEIFIISLEMPLHEDRPDSYNIPNKIIRKNDMEMPVGGR
jgi:LytS/YehU family sensor histidine kinase